MWFSCRNCGKPANIPQLLKQVDPRLHTEYVKEKYKGGPVKRPIYMQEAPFQGKTDIQIKLPTIEELPENHTARVFIRKRKIPREYWKTLFYADAFFAFANTLDPGKFDKGILKHDEARIVIPFYDINKTLITVQGRALGESKLKYITIKVDKDQPHIFGADRLDFEKRAYIVEGPFDSLFLSNALACAQSDLSSAAQEYGIDPSEDVVLVFDNEPRNKDIVRLIKKAIKGDWKIALWPKTYPFKDVNDGVLGGLDPERILETRVFSGARAELELNRWSM